MEAVTIGYICYLAMLLIGRISTIIIGMIAFYMAWQSNELVFEMVSYAWED